MRPDLDSVAAVYSGLKLGIAIGFVSGIGIGLGLVALIAAVLGS